MADNIGTVVIPAPVVQLKDNQFLEDGVILPQILEVPCIQSHIDLGRYWAIPTKDEGIFTGWWYQPATTVNGTAIAQPTYDSFPVLRIRDKLNDYTWWVLATLTQFTAACNTCCGAAFTPITYTVPVISPCQFICDAINADGNYYVVFAAPTLGAGQTYTVHGSFDNIALPNGTLIANLTALLVFLNANYTLVGDFSPQASIVWTRAGNTIIGTLQSGLGNQSSMCLSILAV